MSDAWASAVTVFSSVGILLVTMMGLIIGLLAYFRTIRAARYDSERHRAELEMLRESFESKIYNLNDRLVSTNDRWENVNHLLLSKLSTQVDLPEERQELGNSGFLRSYGISETEVKTDPTLVFVLTPFHGRFWEPFEQIAAACRELNLQCVRGDEQLVHGDLLPHIIRLILRARIIVANVDGRNPNVFYELGIAHALNKTTILISKSPKNLPIDLRLKKLVVYDTLPELRVHIQRELARSVVSGKVGGAYWDDASWDETERS